MNQYLLEQYTKLGLSEKVIAFGEQIEAELKSRFEKIDEIDSIIDSVSNDWKVERISCVSIAVLRLAVFEIRFCDDIPSAVSINEAVALAKKYEGEDAAPFVNGILGKISGK